jgi:hypothetical protein
MLIIEESCIAAFLLIFLLQFYPYFYLALPFYSYTCWVPTISVLNLAIFPYYSNLMLRRRWWTGILQQGVLHYVLPRLSFMWCYAVFHCSVLLRVVIVFRDTTYEIIILYSWYLVICEHFWPYVWNYWSWVMHTMSTWFWHKNRVWHQGRRFISGLTSKSLGRFVNGLTLKPTGWFVSGLASKPLEWFISSLAPKSLGQFSPVWPQNRWRWFFQFGLKISGGFLGCASKPRWWRVFRLGSQNRQLRFSNLGLKITATVFWFVP